MESINNFKYENMKKVLSLNNNTKYKLKKKIKWYRKQKRY